MTTTPPLSEVLQVLKTNTPRPGETPEQIAARQDRTREAEPPQPPTRVSDPAPDPIDAARLRAVNLVQGICNEAKLQLKSNRDDIDNLMARMNTSEAALAHYIGEFAGFSAEVMKAASQIRLEIADVAKPFAASPPSTITQLKNGETK